MSKDEKKIAPYMQYDKDSKKIVFKDLYYVYGNNKEFLFKFNDEDNELIESRDEGGINLGIWNTPQNRERFIKEAVALASVELLSRSILNLKLSLYNMGFNVDGTKAFFLKRFFEKRALRKILRYPD